MIYAITFTEEKPICGIGKKPDHFTRWRQHVSANEITIDTILKNLNSVTYNGCDFLVVRDRINPFRVKVTFDSNGKVIDICIPPLQKGKYAMRDNRDQVVAAILLADEQYAVKGDYIPYNVGFYQDEEMVQKLTTLIKNL